MLGFAAHCRMWQEASKGTFQRRGKRTCERCVLRAKSKATWENCFINMVNILNIYEQGKNLEGEVREMFGPCPLRHLLWVLDMSLDGFKVVNME